jgi:MFS family permease
MGLVAPSSYLAINSYFISRRGVVMGICQAGIGLGFIVVPYLVEAMLRNYGFRGTMLLLGGISLNAIVGALLYQPVEWHSFRLRLHKTINKVDETGKCLVLSNKKRKRVICLVTSRCYRRLAPFHLLAVRHVILDPTSTPCFNFP